MTDMQKIKLHIDRATLEVIVGTFDHMIENFGGVGFDWYRYGGSKEHLIKLTDQLREYLEGDQDKILLIMSEDLYDDYYCELVFINSWCINGLPLDQYKILQDLLWHYADLEEAGLISLER